MTYSIEKDLTNTTSVTSSINDTSSVAKKKHIVEKKIKVQTENEFERDLPRGFVLYTCLASLSLSLFLAALDIMIVSTLIEDVSTQFGDYSKIGWIFTGYSLPNALLSLIWGRLAQPMGFKSSMLTAIIIFEIGSLISAVADSMNMLIGGRVVSGIGGSGLQSLCFVIGSSLVEERKRGIVVAFMSASFGIASVIGPFIGGAFTSHVTWRWCFYINLPVGGLAFFMFAIFYDPNGKKESLFVQAKRFLDTLCDMAKKVTNLSQSTAWIYLMHEIIFMYDAFEFVLCTTGMVLILLALTFGGNRYAWNSASTIVLFVVGILLTIASVIYDFFIFPRFKIVKENQRYQPLMSWKNLKKPGIFTANFALFCVCTGYICQFNYIVQFFQLVYGNSAWKASIHLIAACVSTVLTVMLCGTLNNKFGIVKPLLVVSGTLGFIGAGILLYLDNHSTSAKHIGLLILPGIAFGGLMQSSLISTQLLINKKSNTFRQDFIAVTTFNAFAKNLGSAFGGVLSDTVFSASAINKVNSKGIAIPGGNTANNLIIFREMHFDSATSELGNVISESIKDVFYMALGFSALGFLFCLFTSNKKVDIRTKEEIKKQQVDEVTSV